MKLFNWLSKEIDEAEISAIAMDELKSSLSTKKLAFYLASSYIANTISKCEIKRFVKGKAVKDSFYYLFNVSPNINENASQFKRKLIHKLFTDDDGVLVFENGGNLYVADSFIREPNPIKGDKFTQITLDDETKTFTRKASDVFYFKLDEGEFKTLIDSMLNDYADILNYSVDVYKSNNTEKYKLVLDEIKVGDKEFNDNFEKVIKKQLEAFINNRKAVYPQFKGQSLERIGNSDGKTDSTDIRNLTKEIFEETAKAFKMPISMLYGNMTNAKDIINSFVTFSIDPISKMISEELSRKTSTMEEYLEGTYMDVDTTMIMHVDIFENAEKIDKLIASGTYNQDDIRIKLGDNPINTTASKTYWITKNYSTIETALTGEDTIVEGGE